ncbi:heat shock protein beta-3 [Eublepharis macularius]|uniref:Heat shock protein beta-3 n=1 Tax=Eublepharis macularius TaxID=481883 RepID=A0AA97JTT9_EUBMA|nr:heat shock protein beta-3 [Eublepharis macularius]
MEGVLVIRHRVETPVRYQEYFAEQDFEACRLNHCLYALPGPATAVQTKNTETIKNTAEAEQKCPKKGKPKFQVLLDVVQFRPEDVIIQTFEGWLLIKAQHGPRMDEHGFITRSFTRQYKLPEGIETKDLTALFCHDGILVIEIKTVAEN